MRVEWIILLMASVSLVFLIPQTLALKISYYDNLNEDIINNTLDDFKIPSYVHNIVFMNKTRDWLGLYIFGGNVYINIENEVDYYFWSTLEHELRHAYWFSMMSKYEQKRYCEKYGYPHAADRDCWEHFANNFGYNGVWFYDY